MEEQSKIKASWDHGTKNVTRQRWNRLTDDDLTAINGDRDLLLDVLERRYSNVERETLEQQVDDFEDNLQFEPEGDKPPTEQPPAEVPVDEGVKRMQDAEKAEADKIKEAKEDAD